ncbi:outer membrane lipoprotein-sorting protein [Alteromonas sp. ASW11-130]|uniref:outer membrane lipoprotein-sorting protein n=1 Tax=Alteromonas sp. ASW11-130 TaxID=3015775 RepID=UPI002242AA7F|nr:outer membrane lipoprotein-sorting protein [Alteromonas sp. ASW11-130]MCW8093453.1 outer membrane lipoprotein-sorting protein [Alteromonas sp. ASW11-130]
MKSIKLRLMLVTFPFVVVASNASAEQNSVGKGYEIAALLDTRDAGFEDSSAKLSMILKNGQGAQTVRELQIKILENTDQGDKSLITFDFPADIKGTALLTHPSREGTDDQWLFLPTVDRTKRISSRNKSGAFMGSEFSFEDMTNKNLEDYNYRFLRTEACPNKNMDNSKCDVITRFPVDKHSGYSKQIMWIEQDNKQIHKIEYYDRKDSLLKVFTATDFKLYNDKYWRANVVEMRNVQTNKATVLEYSSIQFGSGLTKREFHRSSLGK